jgi:signal transduction histidine kinase
MSTEGSAAAAGTSGAAAGWVPYRPGATLAALDDDRWLGLLGLRSFRILLSVAIAAILSVIAGYGLTRGTVSWVDAATAVTLALAFWLVTKRPDWFKPLSWVVFAALLLDVLDGLWPPQQRAVTATHVLMPMLVLYGALLCDIAITVAATTAVLGLCFLTWVARAPLSAVDAMMLFNVALATTLSGATALGIWIHHRRLMRGLREQAAALRFELETNTSLTAVIFHDIANPLSALVGTLELAGINGVCGRDDVSLMSRMAGRIAAIIDTVRATASQGLATLPRELVTAERMEGELREVFAERLAAKRQTFSLAGGAGLGVRTVPGILINSVLGNLLSNAIKFSPPGSRLEMRAASEGSGLRVEIRDQGAGFPPEFFAPGAGRVARSTPGTEGEKGFGRGLGIVALHVAKLGGTLEIMNRPGGGASASVVLPERAVVGDQAGSRNQEAVRPGGTAR